MNLETEDVFPQGDTLAARPVDTAPTPIHPAALFSRRPAAVPVIVKKRRLALAPADAPVATAPIEPVPAADEAERRPRVFVLAKEAAPDADAADAAVPAADAMPAPPRRRRRPALHRPSPVVHIVPPAPEPEAPAAVDDAWGLPLLPAVDEYRALRDSLQGLRALVDDARRAQAFTLRPRRPASR